jgi:hypothetical protein
MQGRTPYALLVLATLAIPSSSAQELESYRRFTASAGGAFAFPAGKQSGEWDRGYGLQSGGGYFFNEHLGLTGNFLFTSFGVSGAELNRLNQSGGSASVIGVTADPTYRFHIRWGLSAYVFAGGGYLRRSVELTHNSVAQTINIGGTQVTLNPGFSFFGPPQVIGPPVSTRNTEGSGAVDGGIGLNVPLPRTRFQLFVEGRYMRGFTNTSATTIIPVTLGIRW